MFGAEILGILRSAPGEFFLYEIDQTLFDQSGAQQILQPAAAEFENLTIC